MRALALRVQDLNGGQNNAGPHDSRRPGRRWLSATRHADIPGRAFQIDLGTRFANLRGAVIQARQQGTVLKMRAKPGKGDALFELTKALHYTGDPDGPVDWVLCRADEDPDTLWAFEFYRDEASFARHFANPEIDNSHEEVIELLAEMPLRVVVHPFASSSDVTSEGERGLE